MSCKLKVAQIISGELDEFSQSEYASVTNTQM